MKVMISGGGTGGHIYPGIAIADMLTERERNAQILFVGTARGLESSLIPERGYNFKPIRVKGFRRKLSADTFKTLVELFRGMVDANSILKEFKPDIVIGTGGYVAGPVLLLAAMKGIPTLIHEQNVMPGVTNRILARFVDRVAVSFDEAAEYFGNREKLVVTGNPIRKEILYRNKEDARQTLGFETTLPLVLVFGGSSGSTRLNRAMADFVPMLCGDKQDNRKNRTRGHGFQLLHVTGNSHYPDFIRMLKDRGIYPEECEGIKVVPYLHRMPDALAAADMVIASAGAITLAEITAVGLPAVLIPKPYVTGNHQEYNARAVEKKGAAAVILEEGLDGEGLFLKVSKLIGDKKALQDMQRASKKIGKTDASERIYRVIRELVKQ